MERVVVIGEFESINPDDVSILKSAKNLGEFLIVLLSVTPGDYFMDRITMLKELACVDTVVPFVGSPLETIRQVKPMSVVVRAVCDCAQVEPLVRSWGGDCIVITPEASRIGQDKLPIVASSLP